MQAIRLIAFAVLTVQAFNPHAVAAANDADDILDLSAVRPEEQPNRLRLALTISAKRRFLEVSWKNAPADSNDRVLLTQQQPYSFEQVERVTGTPLAAFDTAEGSGFVPQDGITSTMAPTDERSGVSSGSGFGSSDVFSPWPATAPRAPRRYWTSNNGKNRVVVGIQPTISTYWVTTGVHFDYNLSSQVTANTTCYGYWASYINGSGSILASTCLRAFPRWMHDMRSVVSGMRVRDLFIPGTHDSGSYVRNFDPLLRETIVTKYALTQDDDIRGQLMHGARYLDIRVGYYKYTPERFFLNHGVVPLHPLSDIIEQVKDFVLETNEIVIFGLKEFPIGFGKDLRIHRLLAQYLKQQFGDLIVHPSATWSASLHDIWLRRQNVILAYDKGPVVNEFPQTLFDSVEQRWGNVQYWLKLEGHLRNINTFDVSRLSSRPVADMAELTPDTWGVVLDKYGGLRKMADNVNRHVSRLYDDELGQHANIVAVDFIRGTNLVEIAIEWNKRKVIH